MLGRIALICFVGFAAAFVLISLMEPLFPPPPIMSSTSRGALVLR